MLNVYQHAMGRTPIWQPEINKDIWISLFWIKMIYFPFELNYLRINAFSLLEMQKFKTYCVFKMGLETYTEIYFSVTFNLVGKNTEGLTVFILELDDVMVKQPKTTGYEFFILHDIDNIDN